MMVYQIQVLSKLAANIAAAGLHRVRHVTAGNIHQLFVVDIDFFILLYVFHILVLLRRFMFGKSIAQFD